MPARILIATAKAVAEKHGLRQVLLIGFDGEGTHVVTYGKTKADCAAAARAQDFWTGRIREFAFEPSKVQMPAEPGTCEADDSGWLLAFVVALHEGLTPSERPQGWSDFSDHQRGRIKAAYRAMVAARPA